MPVKPPELLVRRCRSRCPEYDGKWTAAVICEIWYDDEDSDDPIVDGRIDRSGVLQEGFAQDQLFDTKEDAEEAVAKYLLLQAVQTK